MAVVNQVSTELTRTDAGLKVASPSWQSRMERRYFSITTVAGDATSTIRLVPYYKDERLMGGHIASVIAGATNATLSVGSALPGTGVAVTAAKFLAATAIDSALNADFGMTPALGFGELQTADGEVLATVNTAALLVAIALAGYIDVLKV